MMVTSNALIGAKLTEIILPLRMNSSALRNIVNGTPTVDITLITKRPVWPESALRLVVTPGDFHCAK